MPQIPARAEVHCLESVSILEHVLTFVVQKDFGFWIPGLVKRGNKASFQRLEITEIWRCACCCLVRKFARLANAGGHHVDAMLCSV